MTARNDYDSARFALGLASSKTAIQILGLDALGKTSAQDLPELVWKNYKQVQVQVLERLLVSLGM